MTEPSAKVIADSISPAGHRLTTFEVVMHRFVLAEFNTHRVFSRNSASSRAIPLHKQLDRVRSDTARPVRFPLEQPGMQGADAEVVDLEPARSTWEDAAAHAVIAANTLGKLGVHKSVANRLLEPFMWHTVVVTATAWENFFGLRCNPMAQPEIRVAAEAMHTAYGESGPRKVGDDEWHLPYIQDDERDDLPVLTQVQISSARVAAVSYVRQAEREIEKEVKRYEKLTSAVPMHASPLEHVATPHAGNVQEVGVASYWENQGMRLLLPKYGNLLGWHQHRFDVEVARNYQAFA